MNAIGIIPARYASTRFAGKVLAKIGNKPVIQYVYENAKQSKILDDLIVATDSEIVLKAVERFNGKAVLTSKEHRSGTDRIKEAVNSIDTKVVVNIQGDEPLIHPAMIDSVAEAVLNDSTISAATIAKKIDIESEIVNPNTVKVVLDKNNFALYFSRSPIPHSSGCRADYYKHIGVYAYSKDFLFTFISLPVSSLEEAEKLEQLRILENGYQIKVIETSYDTIGVDTPEDLERVKEKLKI